LLHQPYPLECDCRLPWGIQRTRFLLYLLEIHIRFICSGRTLGRFFVSIRICVCANSMGRIVRQAALIASLLVTVALAQNPVPQIVGPVKPTAVAPGSGAFTLTVYGANFVSGAVVNWNGQARSTSFVSAHEVQAMILASDVATSTAAYVTVTNPSPGGGKSSTYAQVEVHAPTTTIVANKPNTYDFGWYLLLPADFRNDNDLDLLGPGPGGIDLRLGEGNGAFPVGSVAGRNYRSPLGIAYGDFNGDGNLDIAYVSGDSNNLGSGKQIVAMLGDGTGKFTLASRLAIWAGVTRLAVGDFNRDGKLDLAVMGNSVTIFLGNGDGTFKQSVQYPGVSGYDMAVADFNGDGNLDLIWLNSSGTYILFGKGDGRFNYPATAASPLFGCGLQAELVMSDFNKDGIPDLVLCNATQVAVLIGNGDGSFQAPALYPAGASFEVATGDFMSNGGTDIIISRNDNNQFLLLPGNGDGTFQSEQAIALPVTANGELGMAVGDFNNDGLLDFALVVSNGTAEVFTQR
jgi:hypothetical protein